MSYDVEGRMSHIDSTALTTTADYTYDGEGHRIISTINNVTTYYVYDAFGNLAAEYGGSNTDSGTQYLTTDHLGSTRLITGSSPVVVKARIDYTPFGEEIAVTGCGTTGAGRSPRCDIPGYLPAVGSSVATNVRLRFTGKERDLRSDDTPYGLDYFGARYFSGAQRRWTSPDPSGRFDPRNPQSWNRYSYGFNNPVRYVDPNGEWPQEYHYQLIHDTFGHYGSHFEQVLRSANDWVDSRSNQSPERSFMHGMADGVHLQRPEQARRLADDYVIAELQAAVDQQLHFETNGGTAYSEAALERFGHALHTVTDIETPQHQFQPWNGLSSWSGLVEGVQHRQAERTAANSGESRDMEARDKAHVAAARIWTRFNQMLERGRAEARKSAEEGDPHDPDRD
jgi:RHS repeat-associated protein